MAELESSGIAIYYKGATIRGNHWDRQEALMMSSRREGMLRCGVFIL